MKRSIILVVALAVFGCQRANYSTIAPPWTPDYNVDRSEGAIRKFEHDDSLRMPAPGGIVFTGSSSFTKWTTAAEDLAPLPVINRGFGGSTFPEVIHYADRSIFKYKPDVVVVYCENDMFGKKEKSPEQVRDAYVTLTKMIHDDDPKTKIYFVSLKPSPSRWKSKDKVIKANQLIKDFIGSVKNQEYIDIWPVMIRDGRPDPSLFVSDSLHMSRAGYERWITVVKPVLEKSQNR